MYVLCRADAKCGRTSSLLELDDSEPVTAESESDEADAHTSAIAAGGLSCRHWRLLHTRASRRAGRPLPRRLASQRRTRGVRAPKRTLAPRRWTRVRRNASTRATLRPPRRRRLYRSIACSYRIHTLCCSSANLMWPHVYCIP